MPIAGRPLLEWVVRLVQSAVRDRSDVAVTVATDNKRIAAFAESIGCPPTMTPAGLTSGSSRAYAAACAASQTPRWVVNVQGDAPFTPVEAITRSITALQRGAQVVTPVVRLSWTELDEFRVMKRETPFSGTTCVRRATGEALWFSKHILPVIRDEADLRRRGTHAPVFRHLGLYGYTLDALAAFHRSEPSLAETMEGLEQLRFLELSIPVETVLLDGGTLSLSGIDSPEDVGRAERLLALHRSPEW